MRIQLYRGNPKLLFDNSWAIPREVAHQNFKKFRRVDPVETRGYDASMEELTNQCKEIILGSLLGDGSLVIPKRYKRARFEFRHAISQKEYFLWKVSQLKEISGDNCFQIQPADGWSKKEKLHYHSRVHLALTELYYLARPEGKLCLRDEWLKLLTPISLMVWWLDDGSLVKNLRQGIFCTGGFSRYDLLTLSQYLKDKWGVKNRIGRRAKYYQLRIYSTEELKKFLRLILPYLPVASMLPKVILLYKDSSLQQRWISEVCRLSKFSQGVVKKYLEEKKLKWQMFRE